ncbi:hypothetical protein BASA81_002755 [Batrachochytrium salamandrivorans]|nr:hypothetical protein BASA81_002755 [Batrachochytrium salamandrivorans]
MLSSTSALVVVTGMVGVTLFCALLSFPTNFERNLPSLLFVSLAWILYEIDSTVVLRSLLLALLEGEVFHRVLCNTFPYSKREIWISVFACVQEAFVPKLVWKLFVVAFISKVLWEQLPVEAVRTRSLSGYWELSPPPGVPPTSVAWRRDWGNVLQLVITRRLYAMLSDRSKLEVEQAKVEFLREGDRDKFTLAVLSSLSKQSTVRVLRSTQGSNQMQAIARRAAAFLEQKVASSAWNQVNNHVGVLAIRLPSIIDPAEGGLMRFSILFAVLLLVHKRGFKWAKSKLPLTSHMVPHAKHVLFLIKQFTRFGIVLFLLARFALGNVPQTPPPTTPRIFPLETPARPESSSPLIEPSLPPPHGVPTMML